MKIRLLKKHFPLLLWLFAIIAFFNFFRQPINMFIYRVLVSPVIATYENSVLNSILLSTLSLILGCWLWMYGGKKFLRQLAIGSILCYLLMYTCNFWEYYTFPLLPFLRTWDIVALALIFPAIRTIFKKSMPSAWESNLEGFAEDLPIENIDEDSFNRSELAKEIAYKVGITANKKSFAIGILGEYGSGKTSFLNLIKSYLDRTKTEIVDFNPWSAENSANIQQDFFDLLAARLYKMDPKISSLVLDYSRKLSRADSSLDKIVRQAGLAGTLFTRGSYVDDYNRINELLAASGKKIVVTIDDVDRLYKEEILEVLRLIRNTASFTNIFYLVAYERTYMEEAISSLNANVASSFLDKIIQLEIPLPKRENNDLLDLLEEHLKLLISPEHIEAYKNNIIKIGFRNDYEFTFQNIFRQSRDVIKFINNFKITYIKLKDEVFFENLFVLELVKFRFPVIYDQLYENKKLFIHDQLFHSFHTQYYELNKYMEDKKSKLSITRTLREESKYEESEIKLIEGLLNHLFFKFDRVKNAKNSIIYPMFFDRYFKYRLSNKEISERQFQKALSEGLSGIHAFIDLHQQKKMLREVTTRLFQEKTATREHYELQVESLFYLGPMYINENGRRTFDYSVLTDLIWNHENHIDKKYYNKDESALNAFISKMFDAAKFPYLFEHELISQIKKNKKDVSLTEETMKIYQVRYFKQHVAQNNLSEDSVFMFWWTDYTESILIPDKPGYVHKHRHIEPEMGTAMKTVLPNYDPFNFLRHSIKYDMWDKGIYTIHKEVLEIFEEPEELRDLVAHHPSLNENIREEYLAFFDACQSDNFKWPTLYTFATALIPNHHQDAE